ncbi:MAG: TRAP transporter small permease [Pseudomonadota bacterium]
MTDPHQSQDRPLPPLVRAIEGVSGFAGGAGAILLGCLFSLMLAEVAARNLFGQSLHVTWELSAYAMAGTFFLAAAATMREGEHVRVGILLELLPDKAARGLDLIVTISAMIIVAYIAYAVGGLTARSLAGDVRSWSGYRIPLAIPQSVLVLGAAILALQLLARALRLLGGFPADRRPVGAITP